MFSKEKLILRVSYLSILLNILLTVFKIICGVVGHSISMISDGVHSLSDVLSTLVVIVGVRVASKRADKSHPYGHERMESIMSIVIAVILIYVGVEIGKQGMFNILKYKTLQLQTPTIITVIAAIVSIIVKEVMYWITYLTGKKVNSSMLIADAWHHRSDALSSIGSLAGIICSKRFILADSIASIVISLFILKVAYDIVLQAVDRLVDKSCSEELQKKIKESILSIQGVIRIDDVKTRMFADKIFVDTEIAVNGNLKVVEGHEIAQQVHDVVEKVDNSIKHCTVHVNPS